MTRWSSLLVVAVTTLAACDEREPPPRPPLESSALPFPSARRPDKTFFAEAEGRRCVVYWESEQGYRSQRSEIRCPRELETGERLRLTGRTCQRESARKERTGPVRCPYVLVKTRKETMAGEGELNLPVEE